MKYFILILSVMWMTNSTFAQLSIYQSNPLGLISKERIKIEYHFNQQNSLSIAGAAYWNFNQGQQVFLEYRRYSLNNNMYDDTKQFFWYGKFGGGISGNDANSKFIYSIFGGGLGWHRYLSDNFFIDIALGLKGSATTNNSSDDNNLKFITIGPGSFLDVAFHLGFDL